MRTGTLGPIQEHLAGPRSRRGASKAQITELTAPEAAYVLRFCYEAWRQLDGPGTTIADCRGYYTTHYYDLATLATVSGI